MVIIVITSYSIHYTKLYEEKRRFAIVINFIIAGILSPPDILSQFAFAIPLLLLYE
ncbi:MAG TPA: twin-arginine translocase subunit TatC, partial [Rickettsia endosymbiont of Diachasma alloeum]|nr:twin-arginine translocase subunit TatC [Rickettsia endosymbiont of Diachasma alloeum]